MITTHISIIEKPRWPLAQRSFNWEFSCDCFTLTPLSRPKVRGPTLESGCRCALDRPCDGHHNSIYFCDLDGVTRSVKRDLEFFGVEMLPLRWCATWLIRSRDSTGGNECQSRLIIFEAGGLPVRARKFELSFLPDWIPVTLIIAVRFRRRFASRGALPVSSTCVFAICCEGTRAFTQRSRAHENQLGKSDYYLGERDSGGIAGLGNLPASTIHIPIRHAQWGCAPVFAMAAFYDWESALDPAVPVQVHGVPDRAVVFFAFISELSG